MSRRTVLAAALLVILLLALSSGFQPLYILLYVGLGATLLGYLWAWLLVRGIEAQFQLLTPRPEVNSFISFKVTLSEQMGIPRVGLAARVLLEFAATSEEAVVLRRHGEASWSATAMCQRRGLHKFGSLVLVGQDPFGLVQVRRELGSPREIVVYPATVPVVSPATIASSTLTGGGQGTGGVGARQMYANLTTVREYKAGDRTSTIHWPTTARLGYLMAKQFQGADPAEVWLLLDFHEAAHIGTGSEKTEEHVVTIAASLAKHFISSGQAVGQIFRGDDACYVAPKKGADQLEKLLRPLALVRARGAVPLATIVANEASAFAPGDLLIAVQPTNGISINSTLQMLRQRGTTAVALILDSTSFNGQHGGQHVGPSRVAFSEGLTTQRLGLGGREENWSRLVREGDNLGQLLGGFLRRLSSQ